MCTSNDQCILVIKYKTLLPRLNKRGEYEIVDKDSFEYKLMLIYKNKIDFYEKEVNKPGLDRTKPLG